MVIHLPNKPEGCDPPRADCDTPDCDPLPEDMIPTQTNFV